MQTAREEGIAVVPVWNKSFREHQIIGTTPDDVRAAADAAVATAGWRGSYFVDADHIGLGTVAGFIAASDFFTIDVADFIGTSAPSEEVGKFVARHEELLGDVVVEGLSEQLRTTREQVAQIAAKYLLAVREAGKVFREIEVAKGEGAFVTEVSMDETDAPQTPVELLVILAAIADARIPVQTIAPKFTGRFNKGVDYVGDVARFEREFNDDLAVIAYAVAAYGLPRELKISVHSGSDKFSIYGAMRRAIRRFDAGLHLKTAGTTWLEELIGLAQSGGEGLALAKEVYRVSVGRFDELCAPYATVVDIDRGQLPAVDTVAAWSGGQFAAAVRHDRRCPDFNPHVRQLLHVGYKVAAEMGTRYLDTLDACESFVAPNVTRNILERHVRPLFRSVTRPPARRPSPGPPASDRPLPPGERSVRRRRTG